MISLMKNMVKMFGLVYLYVRYVIWEVRELKVLIYFMQSQERN